LSERIARVRQFAKGDARALQDDRNAFELVSFNLVLGVQLCADIASHVISDEGWSPATNLGESFVRLHEHGAISEEVCFALRGAVGLRNIVAHRYGSIDYDSVAHTATSGLQDMSLFAKAVATWADPM
jgi:uncharacterized protein YutE (UPF0331/DUF86 family)